MGNERTESLMADHANVANRQFEISKAYSKRDFKMNRIHTSKYNVFTFLPKNLLEQFSKMANAYFLMIALLEVIFPFL